MADAPDKRVQETLRELYARLVELNDDRVRTDARVALVLARLARAPGALHGEMLLRALDLVGRLEQTLDDWGQHYGERRKTEKGRWLDAVEGAITVAKARVLPEKYADALRVEASLELLQTKAYNDDEREDEEFVAQVQRAYQAAVAASMALCNYVDRRYA
jgi:hypothetical protein